MSLNSLVTAAVARAQKSPEVQKNVSSVYQSLSKDVAVRGVGLTIDDLRVRPESIISRGEFTSRMLDAKEIEHIESVRERRETTIVRLITAVLDPNSGRKWIIEFDGKPRSVRMADKNFLKLLAEGKITTQLSSNIRLEAGLLIAEKLVDRHWHVTQVIIERVHRLVLPKGSEQLTASVGNKEAEQKEHDRD